MIEAYILALHPIIILYPLRGELCVKKKALSFLHSPSETQLRSSLLLRALPVPVWVKGFLMCGMGSELSLSMDPEPIEGRPR